MIGIARLRPLALCAMASLGCGLLDRHSPQTGTGSCANCLPEARQSGLDHIVVIMMENRSFDHLLGWLPGADGKQAGLTYADRNGVAHATHPLAPDYQGCGHPDPDHSVQGGVTELDGGACDGWLRAGSNDDFAIGYYTEFDLPFWSGVARSFTTFDRYFSAILGPSLPNRLYAHAGVTDRLDDSILPPSDLPTIWDRLATAGVSARYYYNDLPVTGLWGIKYAAISRTYSEFLSDAASGQLPAVSFVDPRFVDEASGTSADYAPHSDIRAGESFLDVTYRALIASPAWPHTALFITFDEAGGFFDHVPPSRVADVDASLTQRGFRVPAALISPFARRGAISHHDYDHASILKLIEWRFGLPPLAVRDAEAANLAAELDFAHPDTSAPLFSVPALASGPACPGSSPGLPKFPTIPGL